MEIRKEIYKGCGFQIAQENGKKVYCGGILLGKRRYCAYCNQRINLSSQKLSTNEKENN